MRVKTMHDLLHEAEKSIRRDGITDFNFLVPLQMQTVIRDPNSGKETVKKDSMLQVSTFSVGIVNTSDIKIDHHMASDKMFLHDVYTNLSYIFSGKEWRDQEFNLSSTRAQEVIKRAQTLRLSMEKEVTISSTPSLKGNALQRVVRLGKDYLTVLRLFYTVNAISVASNDEYNKTFEALFPKATTPKLKAATLKNVLAITRLIPARAISEAVYLNNMLTGAVTVTGDINDDVIDYAGAIDLILS